MWVVYSQTNLLGLTLRHQTENVSSQCYIVSSSSDAPSDGPLYLYSKFKSGVSNSRLGDSHFAKTGNIATLTTKFKHTGRLKPRPSFHLHKCSYARAHMLHPTIFIPDVSDGDIRLSNGLSPQEGTVQVYLNNMWRGVCDNNWDYRDAFVICRQLGYPATGVHYSTTTN